MQAARKPASSPKPALSNRPEKRVGAAGRKKSATRVLRQFRIVFNAVKAHFRQVERTAGLAGAQLWALSVIDQAPGMSVNDLADALDIHQSTASNLLRSLVEQELVAVRRNGPDKRMVQLHTLPAGARLLKKAPSPFAGILPAALASLDARALSRLERDLGVLIAGLDADNKAGSIPLGHP